MHEAYWGVSEPPFALTPDPRFFYMGHANEDVVMMLHYAITRNKGAALLTAGLGMGKTALSHKFASLLDPFRTKVITVVNPALNPLQFHLEILADLGYKPKSKDRQAVGQELKTRLLELYEKGKRIVVILDDAHQIKNEGTFEELRMLLNLQLDDQFLISLVMLGLPTLAQTLAKYQELDQLIAVRERLQPMSVVETGELIMHRMRMAGYTGDQGLFDPDAIMEIHRFTHGVPRLICHLADHALMLGCNKKVRFIDGMLMHEAIEEFYGDEQETVAA